MLENTQKFKKLGLYLLLAAGAVVFAFIAMSYSQPESSMPNGSSSGLQHNSGAFEGSDVTEPSALRGPAPAPQNDGAATDKRTSSVNETIQRKVVKVGALSLLVTKTEDAAEKITSVANGLGGFVEDKNIYNVSETSKSGTITIKVPAATFDEALKKLKEIAIKTNKEEINATDVTEQFVDLEAQLKSLKAEEEQYLKILTNANKIEDILNVSEHLSSVRSDIERLQGEIKYLSGQIDMSSITVSLTEEGDVQLFGIRWRPLFILKQSFRDMLVGLTSYADAMINFIFVLPVLIIWIATFTVVLWTAWKVFRFVKRKLFTPRS